MGPYPWGRCPWGREAERLRYLALDVGDRRIGLAVGDDVVASLPEAGAPATEGRTPSLGVARPLPTLRRRSVRADLGALREIAAKEEVGALVIGLPLTERGEEGHQARRVRAFADACAELGLPIEMYDERFTTAEAARLGAPDPDAGAAAILLEDFFRSRLRGWKGGRAPRPEKKAASPPK